jgi:hypothetical protein
MRGTAHLVLELSLLSSSVIIVLVDELGNLSLTCQRDARVGQGFFCCLQLHAQLANFLLQLWGKKVEQEIKK